VEKYLATMFNDKIRHTFHQEEYFFSIVDVVGVLTESANPNVYWAKMKERDVGLADFNLPQNGGSSQQGDLIEGFQSLAKCQSLKLPGRDGKNYSTDCANMEGVYRIIQSIPSAKAEPVKRWMAQVAAQRREEERDPRLAVDRGYRRGIEGFIKQGYTEEWARERALGITARNYATDMLHQSGASSPATYAISTNELNQGACGLPVKEHKELKGLVGRQNLRDHMTPLEITMTRLGDLTLAERVRRNQPKTDKEIIKEAEATKKALDKARLAVEETLGAPVASATIPHGSPRARQLAARKKELT
jgi:DNA-damage-inducible protein D